MGCWRSGVAPFNPAGNWSIFLFLQKLRSITLPDNIDTIEKYTFANCRELINVVIPFSVKSIGESAFSGCSKLPRLHLPEGMKEINSYTFNNCTSLVDMTIPDSVKTVHRFAFLNCPIGSAIEFTSLDDPDRRKQAASYWLIGLRTRFDQTEEITTFIRKNRRQMLGYLVEHANAPALTALIEMTSDRKIAYDVLDELIQKCEDPETRTVLINHRNKSYSERSLERMERIRSDKAFGLRPLSVADWKKLFSFEIYEDSVCLTAYKGDVEDLVIPEIIGKKPVTELHRWGEFDGSFRSLTLPATIERLNIGSFLESPNLKDIYIEGMNTRIDHADYLFQHINAFVHVHRGSAAENDLLSNKIPYMLF